MAFYDEEYRETLAKKKGFGSYKEYDRYKTAKRKEKLKEIEKNIEEERKRIKEETKRQLEEETKIEKNIPMLERSSEERQKYFQEHEVCQSLQKIVSETRDENSIFKDIEFIEKFTGCKIKRKK